MQKIFITSSGTNVGKTLFTCALIETILNSGKTVHALKPIISDFDHNTVPNDLFYLCNSLGLGYTKENLKKINHTTFSKAMSPDMAARVEKRPEINFESLKKFCEKPQKNKTDYLLVETIGGVMVPLNKNKTTLDLIRSGAETTILVVGSYLGSLSHTLTAYQVLVDAGKKPQLLVISQNLNKSEELYIPVMETIKSLEKFISTPIIGVEKLVGTETVRIQKLSKILTDAKILKII
jgi:dethiobiotin synthetase